MNYLAHIYLSNNKPSIQIGNFIADSVKGKSYLKYPEEIQKGIILHRQIDWFTDNDEIVKKSKRRLHQRYGHYKGVIIDIFYDYFLAKNWKNYSDIPLKTYTHNFYKILNGQLEALPERVQYFSPFMIKNDWLTSYATYTGIEKVLIGMNKRTNEISQMHMAVIDLKSLHKEFEQDFTLFFEKLRNFSVKKLQEINNNFE